MSIFHRVDQRRNRLGPRAETEDRLSLGQSAVVIVGLSALSWAVLISIVVGFRALLGPAADPARRRFFPGRWLFESPSQRLRIPSAGGSRLARLLSPRFLARGSRHE